MRREKSRIVSIMLVIFMLIMQFGNSIFGNVNSAQAAGLTVEVGTGTYSNGKLNDFSLKNTIDMGTIDVSGSTKKKSMTIFVRRTAGGSGTFDPNGFIINLKCNGGEMEDDYFLDCSYDWTRSSSTWSAYELTFDASELVAGNYTADFAIQDIDGAVVNNGNIKYDQDWYAYLVPVKITVTGTNSNVYPAVNGLTGKAGDGFVSLSWNKSSGDFSEYYIYRATGSYAGTSPDLSKFKKEYTIEADDYSGSFTDYKVTNGVTYSYYVSTAGPGQSKASSAVAVKPAQGASSKLPAPELRGYSDMGSVELVWDMLLYDPKIDDTVTDAYEGKVDHFNIYRDNTLVAQVAQNAVIEEEMDDPWSGEPAYGYSWKLVLTVPFDNVDYKWAVAAVSPTGTVGYLSNYGIYHSYSADPPTADLDTTWLVEAGETPTITTYAEENGATYSLLRNGTQVGSSVKSSKVKFDEYGNVDKWEKITLSDTPTTDGIYTYKMKKVSPDGKKTIYGLEYKYEKTSQPVEPPKKPGKPKLTANISDKGVYMTWTAPSSGGEVKGYYIYRTDTTENTPNTSMYNDDTSYAREGIPSWYTVPAQGRYFALAPTANSFYDDNYVDEDWTTQMSPHRYWIAAYNDYGIGEASEIKEFSGKDNKPVIDVDSKPGTPQNVQAGMEVEDNYGSEWPSSDNPKECTIYGIPYVTWDAPKNGGTVAYYNVTVYKGGSQDSVTKVYPHNGLKYVYSPQNLEGAVGTEYKFRVSAVNSKGSTGASDVTMTITGAPKFRAVVGSNSGIDLSWTKPVGETLTVGKYSIYRKTEYATSWEQIKSAAPSTYTKTTSDGVTTYKYTDTDVTKNRKYSYKVVAECGTKGNRESVVREVVFNTKDLKPGKPVNLSYTKKNGFIYLTWNLSPEVQAAGGYFIYYGYTTDTWISGKDLEGTECQNVISIEDIAERDDSWNLKPGDVYIWLTGVSGKGEYGEESDAFKITITQDDINAMATDIPEAVSPTPVPGDEKVTLSWKKSASGGAAAYYRIQRSDPTTQSDSTVAVVPATNAASYSYVDTGLTNGVTYTYYVIAGNSAGEANSYLNAVDATPNGKTADQIAAEEVTALIQQLHDAGYIDKDAVKSVWAVYSSLTDPQKGYVDSTLKKELEDKYNEIIREEAGQDAELVEQAEAVQAVINAVPYINSELPANITEEELDQITADIAAARDAYDDIPYGARLLVDTSALDDLENRVAAKRRAIADKKSADEVASLIAALPNAGSITKDNLDGYMGAINEAVEAYSTLSTSARTYLDNALVEKLKAIRAKVAELTPEPTPDPDPKPTPDPDPKPTPDPGGGGDDGKGGGKDGGKDGGNTPKYSEEWINGKWYNADGTQTYAGILMWKCNATGWWVEDTSGWYPVSQWQKIDGIWYYFNSSGYMASNEYYNGYWFNSDGSWAPQYYLTWKCNETGWWVEDISGWWPASSWLKVDGYWYYFDASGYMVTSCYIDGWWISEDGVCY